MPFIQQLGPVHNMDVHALKTELQKYDDLDGAGVLGFGFNKQELPPAEQSVWADFRIYRFHADNTKLIPWKDLRILAEGDVQFSWVNLKWDCYFDLNWPVVVSRKNELIYLDFDALHPTHTNPADSADICSNYFIAGKKVTIILLRDY